MSYGDWDTHKRSEGDASFPFIHVFHQHWLLVYMSHQLCSFNSLLFEKSSMFRPKATLNIKLVRPQKASSYL